MVSSTPFHGQHALHYDLAGEIHHPNHPFSVKTDDDMTRLVHSVQQEGIRQPILVKKKQNHRFVILSGHRRACAARLCRLDAVPAIEICCSDNEAARIVCQTNLHRCRN